MQKELNQIKQCAKFIKSKEHSDWYKRQMASEIIELVDKIENTTLKEMEDNVRT